MAFPTFLVLVDTSGPSLYLLILLSISGYRLEGDTQSEHNKAAHRVWGIWEELVGLRQPPLHGLWLTDSWDMFVQL